MGALGGEGVGAVDTGEVDTGVATFGAAADEVDMLEDLENSALLCFWRFESLSSNKVSL